MTRTAELESMIRAFRASGLRWTPQRQAVVETLFRHPGHPSAEEIYATVRRRHPGMSRATVYNTMEALASLGRVQIVSAADGTRRYDPNPSPHHHARCRICGSIADVEAPSGLGSTRMPRLGGFRVESVEIEYRGVCPACDRERRTIPELHESRAARRRKPGATLKRNEDR